MFQNILRILQDKSTQKLGLHLAKMFNLKGYIKNNAAELFNDIEITCIVDVNNKTSIETCKLNKVQQALLISLFNDDDRHTGFVGYRGTGTTTVLMYYLSLQLILNSDVTIAVISRKNRVVKELHRFMAWNFPYVNTGRSTNEIVTKNNVKVIGFTNNNMMNFRGYRLNEIIMDNLIYDAKYDDFWDEYPMVTDRLFEITTKEWQ